MSTVIKLAHCTNPTNYYKVGVNAATKTNLKISEINVVQMGTVETLIFVTNYLNYYENNEEICAPEFPLIENIELKDLFELEQDIFEDLLNLDKKEFLSHLLDVATELNMIILLKKVAAIIAYNMQLL